MAEALNSLFKAECVRNLVMRPKAGWKSVGDVEMAGPRRGRIQLTEPSTKPGGDSHRGDGVDVAQQPGGVE